MHITKEDRRQFISGFPKLVINHRTLQFLSSINVIRRRLRMTIVNLDRIQQAIDDGLIDPSRPITMKTLKDAKIVKKIGDGVKLLARVLLALWLPLIVKGKENLAQPITIYVSRASKEAIRQVEEKMGAVTTVYYNQLGLKYLMNPDKFGVTRRVPRAALPVRRYLIGTSLSVCILTPRLLF